MIDILCHKFKLYDNEYYHYHCIICNIQIWHNVLTKNSNIYHITNRYISYKILDLTCEEYIIKKLLE